MMGRDIECCAGKSNEHPSYHPGPVFIMIEKITVVSMKRRWNLGTSSIIFRRVPSVPKIGSMILMSYLPNSLFVADDTSVPIKNGALSLPLSLHASTSQGILLGYPTWIRWIRASSNLVFNGHFHYSMDWVSSRRRRCVWQTPKKGQVLLVRNLQLTMASKTSWYG